MSSHNLFQVIVCVFLCTFLASPVVGQSSVAQKWSNDTLRLIQETNPFLSPPGVARALAIVTTCMYDAMVPYTHKMDPSMDYGIARRPGNERRDSFIEQAISFSAYRCINSIFRDFPARLAPTDALFASMGYNKSDVEENHFTASGIGNKVAKTLLAFRENDGSNQLANERGTKAGGSVYSDYTNYAPRNKPQPFNTKTDCSQLNSISHWQPLRVPTRTGGSNVQSWLVPHWDRVKPFALAATNEFLPPGPPLPGTNTDNDFTCQYREVLNISAALDDRKKIIAEYWADGPRSTTPPGHWHQITIELATSRSLNLVNTVKVLFLQANAVFDAGIAVWNAKRYFDSGRPISVLQCTYNGQLVKAWKGPYEGVGTIRGEDWQPYQDAFFVTPPFAEYPSGHSGFSAASAEVLKRFFGSDTWGASFTAPAGKSLFEPRIDSGNPGYVAGRTDVPNSGPGTAGYVPAQPVTLTWSTFTEAADEAGLSRLYGGIHIESGDRDGRALGRLVGNKVWDRFSELTDNNGF